MYLHSVEVVNFRNLPAFNAEFCPGLNLLVGRNGTGKSNLFRAIRLALGPASPYGDMPWLVPEDRHHTGAGATVEPIRISLTFAGLSETERVLFFDILEFNAQSPENSVARVHFEAPWDSDRGRFLPRRWGGARDGDRPEVPIEVLHSLPLTYLPALRDAESALSPGRFSRLATLLENVSRSEAGEDHESSIVSIFETANEQLAKHRLVDEVSGRLANNAKAMAGVDYTEPRIAASPPQFDRILKGLRVLLPENPVEELSAAGLGYNNLLFIATVLAHLRESPEGEVPLLLIEEPEAHLHPQLVSRLGRFLSGKLDEKHPPQTLVSSHSPLLASQVMPSQTTVLFEADRQSGIRSRSLSGLGLDAREEGRLFRMLDITRATMYFARGLILVEGVSEELLVPPLASLLGVDLSGAQVSVVPVYGVSFETLAGVLGPNGLDIRVAILTDGDPQVDRGKTWREDTPMSDSGGDFVKSDRTAGLLKRFADDPAIQVFTSDVALEYDLAAAHRNNAQVMAEVWRNELRKSTVLEPTEVSQAGSDREAALLVWRGVCRSSTSGSKAAFAHSLAQRLEGSTPGDFHVPNYIREAIRWVCPSADTS